MADTAIRLWHLGMFGNLVCCPWSVVRGELRVFGRELRVFEKTRRFWGLAARLRRRWRPAAADDAGQWLAV
ncbi:MAG TPA: hypothetical protein VNH11_28590 [Pirellulales bacterium]|nr:hypothetical protein [Pirellulales bacterium]